MTLMLIDGLEDSTTAGNMNYASSPPQPAPARNGLGYQLNSGASHYVGWSTPQLLATALGWTIGFAMKASVFSSTANYMVTFIGDNGIAQGIFILNTDASISFKRGTSGSIMGTSAPGIVQLNSWCYVEVQYLYASTNTGTAIVRVNNTVVLTLTNINTASTSPSTSIQTPYLGYPGSANQGMTVDDVYICQGATPDPFLGDIVVETLYPNGNGTKNQWQGSDGDNTNNYLLVNEVGYPNTSTYTKDSVIGDQDMYALDNMKTVAGQVVGVCHVAYAVKTDSGPAQFKVVSHGTADTKSPNCAVRTGSDGWTFTLAQNPDTSAAWTIADVNNLQSGVEIS